MTKIFSVKERIAYWAARENAPGTSLKGTNKAGVTVISNASFNQAGKNANASSKLSSSTSAGSINSSGLRGIDSPKSTSIVSSPTSSPPRSPRNAGSSSKILVTSTPIATITTAPAIAPTGSVAVTQTTTTTAPPVTPNTSESLKEVSTPLSTPLVNNVATSDKKDTVEPPPITASYNSSLSSSSSSLASGPGNVVNLSNPIFELTPRSSSSSCSPADTDKILSASSSFHQEIDQLLKEMTLDVPKPSSSVPQHNTADLQSKSNPTSSAQITSTATAPPIAIMKPIETKANPLLSVSPPQERKDPPVPIIVSTITTANNNTSSPSTLPVTSSVQQSLTPTTASVQPKSLQDIQAAMRRAEQQKKEAQERRAILATPAYAKGRRLSRAERRTIRETRRMTIIDQKVQVEKKIDDFIKLISGFQTMLDKEREETRKTIEKLELVTSLLTLANTELDLMKGTIDRIVEDYTKKHSSKNSEYYQELVKFQEQFWELRHKFHIQVAKGTKELRAQDGIIFLKDFQNPNFETNYVGQKSSVANVLEAFLLCRFVSCFRRTSSGSTARENSYALRLQHSSAPAVTEISE